MLEKRQLGQQVLQLVKMFITQYIQIQLKNKYMVLVVNIH